MLLNESGLENFNKWLAALRSDQYEQANGNLVEVKDASEITRLVKRDMKETCAFCCLGVACFEVGQREIGYRKRDEDINLYINGEEKVISFLPKLMVDKLGIPENMTLRDGDDYDIYVYVSRDFNAENDEWFYDEDFDESEIKHKGQTCLKVKASDLNDDYEMEFGYIADLLEFTYL